MWRTVCIVWCLAAILQGLSAQDTHTIPPLGTDNGIELTEDGEEVSNSLSTSDNSLSLVLEALGRLEAENRQLREDLQQSNSQLQALQVETAQLRQQVNATAGMGSEIMTYVSNTVTTSMEENSEMLQTQLSQLIGFVEEVKSQQGLVLQQTEVMQSVFDVVQEFEDEAANVTTRINDLDNRLSSAEATLLQTQVEGCGCPDQSRVLQRLDDLETAVKELRNGPNVVSSTPPTPPTPSTPPTPPTPPPRSTPESSSGRAPLLEFAVSSGTFGYGDYLITGVLATEDRKLLTTDRRSLEMRMASLDRPEVAEDTITLEDIPWAMLQLPDGSIALTFEFVSKIGIFNINGDDLELVRTIETESHYGGIAPGPSNNTLIVSKWREGEIARLYVISMEGNVERTLLEDVDFMIDPFCLQRFGDDVYVSDWTSSRLFRVNVYTGEASSFIGSLDLSSLSLSQPRQFDFDDSGNLYLATGGRVCNEYADGYFCIIQVTQSGTWKVMEDYTSINGGGYPYGVGVTSRQIIISWGRWDYGWTSELTSYELPLPSEPTPLKSAEIVPTSTAGRRVVPPLEFTVPSSVIGGYGSSLITSVIVTDEDKIVMADYSQQEVKMTSLQHFHRLEDSVSLGLSPWSLLQLCDGTVVVTMEDEPQITFLTIAGSDLQISKSIDTNRRYRGVAQFDNESLVVSTRQNDDDWSNLEARVDIIGLDGVVRDTLLTGDETGSLIKPFFLSRRGKEVFISDWGSHRVLVLNLDTRQVSSSFGNMDLSVLGLSQPRVVAFDDSGNMYVATGGRVCSIYYTEEFCVIQISPNGRWRHLENYTSKNGGRFPYGIDVFNDQIIISWGHWEYGGWRTELTAYGLPSEPEEVVSSTTLSTPSSTRLDTETIPTTTVPSPRGIDISGPAYVELGSPFTLTCTAIIIDLFSIEVDWFKDGERLENDGHLQLSTNESQSERAIVSTLYVPRAAMDDSGTYVCRTSDLQITSARVQILKAEPWNPKRVLNCSTDNSTCMAANGLVCNGHGTCVCGMCRCDGDYMGPTCEECPTCPGTCSENRACVQCRAFGTGNYNQEQCEEVCPDIMIVDQLELGGDRVRHCLFNDYTDGCQFQFTYEYGQNRNLLLKAQRTKECA